MTNQIVSNPMLSFLEVLRAREPKTVFETRLIALLTARLKELGIIWSPKAFRGGLNNPGLPLRLVHKLESIIVLAESVGWNLSKAVKNELDATIEDIETFNPSFRESLRRASVNIKAGRFVTQEEIEKRYGVAK